MKAIVAILFFTGVFVVSLQAKAGEYQIEYKNMRFSQTALTIKVGDTVNFKNSDTFAHNAYSLSEAKSFDLGSYPKGQSRPVTFDRPGSVNVECAVHPDMKMTLTIRK